MSVQQEGDLPETASDIATLGTKYKIQIPKVCMAIVSWPPDGPVPLVVELVAAGCVRLYLASKKLPELRARRAEIQQDNVPNRLELLSVLDDRYRNAILYTKGSEKSVTLEQRTVVYLGVLPNDDRTLFVEATKETIDIISLTFRNRRLELLKDSTSA